MNQYQLIVKKSGSPYKFEPSRVERLCQLIEDAGEYYISLIFEASFCLLKRGSYIKSLYKVHKETDCIVETYKNPITPCLRYIDTRVITYYNKCPHCNYVVKMFNQTLCYDVCERDSSSEKFTQNQERSYNVVKTPQPSDHFINHINKKHGTNFVIKKSTKSYYDREVIHQII